MLFKTIFVFLLASLIHICESSESYKRIECRGRSTGVWCYSWEKYVHITKVIYGRHKDKSCRSFWSSPIKQRAYHDVTGYLQRACYGRTSCNPYDHVDGMFKNHPSGLNGTEKDFYFRVDFDCDKRLPPAPPEIHTRTICEGESVTIGCFEENKVMQVLSATFGRTDSKSCLSYHLDNIECSKDITKTIEGHCEGRMNCRLKSSSRIYGNPCINRETRKFMEIKFKCVPKGTVTTRPPTTAVATTKPPFQSRILCEGKAAFIGCFGPNQVIQILNATFGRTDSQSCPSSNPQDDNNRCFMDATPYNKFQCEGNTFCSVSADAGQYGNPCQNKTTRMFLDVKYKCVQKGSFTPMFLKTTPLIPSVPTAPSIQPSTNITSTLKGMCGKPQIPMSRVVQGANARRGSWPWQIAIYTQNGNFICGGSILSPDWIISAAHCFSAEKASKYYIVVGDTDRSKLKGNEIKYSLLRIIKHRSYGAQKSIIHDYDIAMVKLSRPIRFDKYVQPVCLPTGNSVKTSGRCFTTGWGKTGQLTSTHTKLQQLPMQRIAQDVCDKKLKNAPGSPGQQITRRMFCATATRNQNIAGVCQGDSGGPFVCEQLDGRWVLHGIVSWGSPRCVPQDMFNVFTNVEEFGSWISSIQKLY